MHFQLFHPSTIHDSFLHNGQGIEEGIKTKDGTGKYIWNLNPHKNRIIHYDKSTLKLIGEIVFSESRWENVKLVQLFSKTIINILVDLRILQRLIHLNINSQQDLMKLLLQGKVK